jgi:hypothetical protein
LVELAGIELEALSGREGVFKEDDRESAAEIEAFTRRLRRVPKC